MDWRRAPCSEKLEYSVPSPLSLLDIKERLEETE